MYFNKNIFTIATLLLFPVLGFAAEQGRPAEAGGYNMLLISLVGLILILLFVIGMLANTLLQLASVAGKKFRSDRKAKDGLLKTVAILALFLLPAIRGFAADNGEPLKTISFPSSIGGIPVFDYYFIMGMIFFELIIIFSLVIFIRILLRIIADKPELAVVAKKVMQKSWFWDKLNNAVPMEKEKDLLLDHDYDGIRELDNSLPPWWKYGFYLTILVSFIYIYRFHISNDGQSQQEEYVADMQKGEDEKAAYLAHSANNVDENTVVLLTDGSSISEGRDVFVKNCTACHLPDGGGSVGPNLTDEYWLHGGGVKDIFRSIKYGWQDKGMKSWKEDLSPKQIQELASFIKSLKGSHPAVPKQPQGELYIEATQGNNIVDTSKPGSTKPSKVAIN